MTALVTKMQAVSEISPDRQEALGREATQIVETEVYPAWLAGIAVLESQRRDATADAGLWRFENGAGIYAQRLRTHTTTFRQIRAFGGMAATSEGWALYAERLAAEEGWYDDDPEGRIGQLNSALFRARRLVVDTGLHAMRWTRQQAIDFGIEPSEVDRYVVFPGQACSYMIGQLKIVELRERARSALGDRFSVREFHSVVLGTGIVPLSILEHVVDEYIATAQAS